ncbi:MAG TPA: type II toxin-antitoxin system VapC family toxin, partial [Dehalococcoidia bacterium]|nr:type II toxin-antitoxin system VapC family toxin [Dehalococcoidia bacterium]
DEAMYVSIVTYMEVFQGSLRADDPSRALSELRAFIDVVPILPVTEAVAERCARLREDLLRQGKRPNRLAFDLLIAATALENDLSLVTRNARDYRDISGLRPNFQPYTMELNLE